MNIDALVWKWGTPESRISIIDDEIVVWAGTTLETEPTAQQIEDCEAEYAAYLAAQARGDTHWEQYDPWQPWANEDMDTGTETLVEWTAPSVDAAWKVHGRLSKADAGIAFEAMLNLKCTAQAYPYTGVDREVKLTVQHTAESGDCSGVAWQTEAEVLYSDYDETSGKIRLRVDLPSNNWSGEGRWQRQ